MSKETPAGTTRKPLSLSNPRMQAAFALAGTIALSGGVQRVAATLFQQPAVARAVQMVGAAAAAAPVAPGGFGAAFASDGAQKSLSFLTMIFVGMGLRMKLPNPAFAKGVQWLIMNALLPCVTFKVRGGRYKCHSRLLPRPADTQPSPPTPPSCLSIICIVSTSFTGAVRHQARLGHAKIPSDLNGDDLLLPDLWYGGEQGSSP